MNCATCGQHLSILGYERVCPVCGSWVSCHLCGGTGRIPVLFDHPAQPSSANEFGDGAVEGAKVIRLFRRNPEQIAAHDCLQRFWPNETVECGDGTRGRIVLPESRCIRACHKHCRHDGPGGIQRLVVGKTGKPGLAIPVPLVVFEPQLADGLLVEGCPCFRDFVLCLDNGRYKVEQERVGVEFFKADFIQPSQSGLRPFGFK